MRSMMLDEERFPAATCFASACKPVLPSLAAADYLSLRWGTASPHCGEPRRRQSTCRTAFVRRIKIGSTVRYLGIEVDDALCLEDIGHIAIEPWPRRNGRSGPSRASGAADNSSISRRGICGPAGDVERHWEFAASSTPCFHRLTFINRIAYFKIYCIIESMNSNNAIRALAALAQEHRLAIFRLLVKAGQRGHAGRGDRRADRHQPDQHLVPSEGAGPGGAYSSPARRTLYSLRLQHRGDARFARVSDGGLLPGPAGALR